MENLEIRVESEVSYEIIYKNDGAVSVFFSNYTGTYAGGDQLICGCRADAPGTARMVDSVYDLALNTAMTEFDAKLK